MPFTELFRPEKSSLMEASHSVYAARRFSPTPQTRSHGGDEIDITFPSSPQCLYYLCGSLFIHGGPLGAPRLLRYGSPSLAVSGTAEGDGKWTERERDRPGADARIPLSST